MHLFRRIEVANGYLGEPLSLAQSAGAPPADAARGYYVVADTGLSLHLDVPAFLKESGANFNPKRTAADRMGVSVSISIEPEDLIAVEVSDQGDPPFVEQLYGPRVESSDGNPYLDVPSLEPTKGVRIDLYFSFPFTDALTQKGL